ncbi:hypothetical protein [Methylobacterium goesingense]|uniref:hypothetical protein n=1 Tax=Methylobacterium goesingense TaxID=243690 RepID=UPI0036281522
MVLAPPGGARDAAPKSIAIRAGARMLGSGRAGTIPHRGEWALKIGVGFRSSGWMWRRYGPGLRRPETAGWAVAYWARVAIGPRFSQARQDFWTNWVT